ncbi:unnamed protein product [Meloidogyne enterolobii]|uniref:Uncharacterized protein n=1 Tax=Meloidogyne enterolobii TaxID=390850 RepID=A0ACB0Y5E8_MELEN
MSGLKKEKIPKIEENEEEIIEVELENDTEIINKAKSTTSKINNGKIEKNNNKLNPRVLWKIMRMKDTPRIEIRVCKKCANALYNDKNKFTQKENGNIGICFEICESCAKLNMQFKDFVADWDEKNIEKLKK